MEEKTSELSEREQEILRLIATGASNKEIAYKLVISPNTVKVHVRNIFAKIGAASRTEAAMYAVREGLLPSASVNTKVEENADISVSNDGIGEFILVQSKNIDRQWSKFLAIAFAAIFLLAIMAFWNMFKKPDENSVSTEPGSRQKWKELSPLSTGRQKFAVASFENQIIAIGGETVDSVTGSVEIYSILSDTWRGGSQKPTPVSDIGAVVIGGLVYVPGGKLPFGEVTNAFEVYNPRKDSWESRAPLPEALCGYAFTAFEGRLYIFGGWNGSEYLDTVFSYDPTTDQWISLPTMPTHRAYAGASPALGKIYVIGGINKDGPLSVNEVFSPGASEEQLWISAKELPEAIYQMGVTSLADFIYVIGGISEAEKNPQTGSYQFIPANNDWHSFNSPYSMEWSGLGITSQNTHIYAVGGLVDNTTHNSLYGYEALFIIQLPIVR